MNQNNQTHDTVLLRKKGNDPQEILILENLSEPFFMEEPLYRGMIESTKSIVTPVIEKIIHNLWYNNNYLNVYISYLLGTYTDEEFKKISAKFVRDFDDLSIEEIQYAIIKITNILKTELGIDELSAMINVTHNSIIQALNKMRKK